MKAIVLTFDKYKVFAAHMIDCYLKHWKDCPLIFKIPYQSEETKQFFENRYGSQRVELIKSPSGIVDTINTLLSDIDDDEWMYWCLDDRYVTEMDSVAYNTVFNYIVSGKPSTKEAAFMMNNKSIHKSPRYLFPHSMDMNIDKLIFRRRRTYRMIWGHQFCRAKVIRTMFSYVDPNVKTAKPMDHMVHTHLPLDNQHLFIINRSKGEYGESTSKGKVNKNTVESLLSYGFQLPDGFEETGIYNIYGKDTRWNDFIELSKYWVRRILHGKQIQNSNGEY